MPYGLPEFLEELGYAKTQMACVAVGGGDREKLEVYWEKPGPDQVRFIESVTTVTDQELKLPLSLK